MTKVDFYGILISQNHRASRLVDWTTDHGGGYHEHPGLRRIFSLFVCEHQARPGDQHDHRSHRAIVHERHGAQNYLLSVPVVDG